MNLLKLTRLTNSNVEIYSKNYVQVFDMLIPSHKFEETRRKIFDNVKEVSYYINSQLNIIKKTIGSKDSNIENVKNDFQNRIKLD